MTDHQRKPVPADLVFSFHEGEVPCTFELVAEAGCTAKATLLLRVIHRDDQTRMCGPESLEWLPLCAEHRKLMEKTLTGFWAALMGTMPCTGCGKPVAVGGVREL